MKKITFFFTLIVLSSISAFAGNKTSYRNVLVLAYSQANSVYEDDNIKLEIYNERLWATNKTTKTIFIDLAQCFAYHNETSMPLLTSSEEQNILKKGKASKRGVSTKDDLYITIAPSFGSKQKETYICNMSTQIYGKYSSSETPSNDFTDYDKRLLTIIGELTEEAKINGKYEGTASRHLTEDESINNIGASIAYAFNKNTENWTSVTLSTWVCDVIFAPCYLEKAKKLSYKEKKGFNAKETDASAFHIKADSPFEFDEDKSPLIVCDWKGKFNKGTFELKHTFKFVNPRTHWKIVNSQDDILEKRIIKFDGKNADWGHLSYNIDGIEFTYQKK